MRALFIAVGKVFGLVVVFAGLLNFIFMIPLVLIIEPAASGEGAQVLSRAAFGASRALTATGMVASLIFSLGLGWLLIFKAEWLADRLRIPRENDPESSSGADLLGAGTRILGLFFIVQAAPQLLQVFTEGIAANVGMPPGMRDSFAGGALPGPWLYFRLIVEMLPAALTLFLGFLLAFKTHIILNKVRYTSQP